MERKSRSKQTLRFGVLIGLVFMLMLTGLASEAKSVIAQEIQAGRRPVANNDDYMTNVNTVLSIPAPGVLLNDTDADGEPITARVDVGPTRGSLNLNLNGSFTYTPTITTPPYIGTDTFTYYANDGTLDSSTAATVTIHIGQCIYDACDKSKPCSANDVKVAIVRVTAVDDYCTSATDTGVYVFELEFSSTAQTRYDPTVWITLNGADTTKGCYMDYLDPGQGVLLTLPSPYPSPYPALYGPPFWDFEDSPTTGDQCGDLLQNQFTYKTSAPVTVQCAGFMTGLINTQVAYDSQVDLDNCPNGGCPDVGSKCRIDLSTPVEVRLDPVDIGLTKQASDYGEYVEPGETFKYTLTVTNPLSSPYSSYGYEIFDDLPIWLQVVSLPSNTTKTTHEHYADGGVGVDAGIWNDGAAEFCYGTTGGCNSYGDIIYINQSIDLLPGASDTYEFWVKMWDEPYVGYCDVTPLDPRCVAREFDSNPSHIDNEACVAGFDREDPVLSATNKDDNCSIAIVPTEVQYAYFTATGDKTAITLNWATTNEIDNLGFNIYRAIAIDGVKTKINKSIIPSVNPGSPEGGVYSYKDLRRVRFGLIPGMVYYYWLEDVPMSGEPILFGPVSASLIR